MQVTLTMAFILASSTVLCYTWWLILFHYWPQSSGSGMKFAKTFRHGLHGLWPQVGHVDPATAHLLCLGYAVYAGLCLMLLRSHPPFIPLIQYCFQGCIVCGVPVVKCDSSSNGWYNTQWCVTPCNCWALQWGTTEQKTGRFYAGTLNVDNEIDEGWQCEKLYNLCTTDNDLGMIPPKEDWHKAK